MRFVWNQKHDDTETVGLIPSERMSASLEAIFIIFCYINLINRIETCGYIISPYVTQICYFCKYCFTCLNLTSVVGEMNSYGISGRRDNCRIFLRIRTRCRLSNLMTSQLNISLHDNKELRFCKLSLQSVC